MKNNRIIPKPWGQEEILEINDKYMFKRLTMLKGKRCSLQYHKNKRETIYVLSGKLKIYLGDSKEDLREFVFSEGESITIEPGRIHRMEGLTKSVYLEASTPEVDDVVRIQDDFGRRSKKMKINLGCGKDIRKGYLNLDFLEREGEEKMMGTTKLIQIIFNYSGLHIERYCPQRQAIIEARKLFGNKEIVACEIGVLRGGHSLQMLKNLNIKKLYLIDPYENYEGDFPYKLSGVKEKAEELLREYKDKIVWIEKYSDVAVKDIKEELDFVYIDANHSYPYVKKDIENYYPLIKRGGIISGHDYKPNELLVAPDVIKAVSEFCIKEKKNLIFGHGNDWVVVK